MLILQALILGVVQGLTEILPISSSAHLILLPWMLKWDTPLLNSLPFDVALHFGTLLAISAYFSDDLWDLSRCWGPGKDSPIRRENRRLGIIVVLATIPGAAAGYFLEHQAAHAFRSPLRIAVALILGGVIMGWVDRVKPHREELSHFRRRDALVPGFFQALAIVPGVSRSGSVLTALRLMSLKRQDAARLTFLLSIPLLAGASLMEARHLLHGWGVEQVAPLTVGVLASALTGYGTLQLLLKSLRSRSLGVFAIYRVALGGVILLVLSLRGA